MRQQSSNSNVKPTRDTTSINTTASGMAKETRSSSIVDTNRACSNGRSEEDKYSNGMFK